MISTKKLDDCCRARGSESGQRRSMIAKLLIIEAHKQSNNEAYCSWQLASQENCYVKMMAKLLCTAKCWATAAADDGKQFAVCGLAKLKQSATGRQQLCESQSESRKVFFE